MIPAVAMLLRELVGIPSPSGAEREIADFVAGMLRFRGLTVERAGDSVVAVLDGRGDGPVVMLASHLDTVPAGEGWTSDPWKVDWRGGRLTGLGANDAKGCAAAMILAVLEFARRRPPGRVLLALNCCEETTNQGMEQVLARFGLPDAAVVGEPTGLEVVRSQAGLAILEAEWKGRSCHAAHAGTAAHSNALLRACQELAGMPPCLPVGEQHPLVGRTSIVPTKLRAGDRHNRVPDLATAIFDVRLAPPLGAEECRAVLEDLLPTAEVSIRSQRLLPVDTPEEHPVVLAALRAAGRKRAVGSHTLSDMALLRGVPAVKCGPGRTERSHTPDEYILLEELEAGVTFYGAFLESMLLAPLEAGA